MRTVLTGTRGDIVILPADPNDGNHSISSIRAVILDFGEVISQPPDPEAIATMAATFGLQEDRFRQIYSSLRHGYDRGDIGASQYWAGIAAAAGIELSASQIERLRETDVAMWSRLNQPVLRWAELLRSSGLKTAVLSNMHDDMTQKIRKDPAWEERFDCLALSSEIRMAKPDAEIFIYCLDCLKVAANEALFVDDREANVRAARELGIRGIVANSPAELRRQLEGIEFTPLLE